MPLRGIRFLFLRCLVSADNSLCRLLVFDKYEVEGGDQEEREERRERQAEYDRASESLPEFVGERYGQYAHDRADGCDKDRFQARLPCISHGSFEGNAAFDIQVDLVHEDDGVLDHDAEERENADQSREA